MTDRDRKLLAIVGVAVILGGYWFLVLGKKRGAVAEAEQSKAAAQQALDTAKTSAAAGQREKKRYPVSYSRVVKLGKAIPEDADYASLVVQVSDIADESGVRFESLTSTEGTSGGGATGTTGIVTTCGESGGASSATAAPPAGATGSTGATDANSAVGQTVNNARAGAANAEAGASAAAGAGEQDQQQACSAAPTLTDLAAVQSGLLVHTYSFKFKGSFFRLHDVMHRVLGMVRVNNGRVKVTGRLLQINKLSFDTTTFPDLAAEITMTGYTLPAATSETAGASAGGPAGSPAPTAAPGATPAAGSQ
ncbi:MAG: hypothetical protein HY827_02210 [Actinobacteria bacterium]|nr:hypothetical protein [Actinomycetota bacterium]